MTRGKCKVCGGVFWETYPGARGEELCDSCRRCKGCGLAFDPEKTAGAGVEQKKFCGRACWDDYVAGAAEHAEYLGSDR